MRWAQRVSNPRPPVCKTGALPLSYAPLAGEPTRQSERLRAPPIEPKARK